MAAWTREHIILRLNKASEAEGKSKVKRFCIHSFKGERFVLGSSIYRLPSNNKCMETALASISGYLGAYLSHLCNYNLCHTVNRIQGNQDESRETAGHCIRVVLTVQFIVIALLIHCERERKRAGEKVIGVIYTSGYSIYTISFTFTFNISTSLYG